MCKNKIPCLIINNINYHSKEIIDYKVEYADLVNKLNCYLCVIENEDDTESAFFMILKKVASLKVGKNQMKKRIKKEENKKRKKRKKYHKNYII